MRGVGGGRRLCMRRSFDGGFEEVIGSETSSNSFAIQE